MEDLQRRSSVRRHLSEADEKEVLRVLKEQLRHQKRVTSDDVRLAVRAVAGQGGAVPLPPDFPPARWVLEFKRVHGFVQFNSFVFAAAASGGKGAEAAAFGLPERIEVPPLRTTVTATERTSPRPRPTASNNHSVINDKSNNRSSDDGKKKDPSEDSRGSMFNGTVVYAGPRPSYHNEAQRQVQLQHSFSQRHRQLLNQQQRRAVLVDDHRRAAWPMRPPAEHEEMRSNASSGSQESENGTTTGTDNSPVDGSVGLGVDLGNLGVNSSMTPRFRHTVSVNSTNSVDDMKDSVSNASSSNSKRSYKLSHTVPAETWEKAIAAVEQQGMSLRAAAKMYGVHFAALHRRVKKRAQGGQAKGNNGYFHPSDEAGIMRVVVARAELGVLMTFDELMRLVEAAALRKLPDISVDSARKLLTRFQSRNEQSIRHIIEDWPPPRPAVSTPMTRSGSESRRQPYLEHPGFNYESKHGEVATAAASKSLFVPRSRIVTGYANEPSKRAGQLVDTMRAMDLEATTSVSQSPQA